MKRITLGLALALTLFAAKVSAIDCDAVVSDSARVLDADGIGKIGASAALLVNQGADVRVRTVSESTNLDFDKNNFQKACSSWQSADGGMKNNLIVLMVAPNNRKMAMYYGSAWHSALDNHWVRIKQDYMAPHFRDKDWAGGFVATEQQLTARLIASKDEALHPAVNQTTNQATDLSGLWTVFGWMIGLGAIGVALFFLYRYMRRRREDHDEVAGAQLEAIFYRNQAANLLSGWEDTVKTLEATKNVAAAAQRTILDEASQAYSRLSSTEKNNPEAENLTKAQYELIRDQYKAVCDKLRGDTPSPAWQSSSATSRSQAKRHAAQRKNAGLKPRGTETPEPQPSTSHTDNSIFAPVIINEEREPSYSTPSFDRRSKNDDDDGSSSSSSSSSSSGGSSDFGSSSDSGGGSSDFGSSDSGSGGSSDF